MTEFSPALVLSPDRLRASAAAAGRGSAPAVAPVSVRLHTRNAGSVGRRVRRARPRLVGPLLVGLIVMSLAACGSGGSTGGSTAAPTGAAVAGAAGATPSATRQRTPGVSGLIAAVDGAVLQVQSTTKQTAVSYTSTTVLTRVKAGTLADVTVGSCVVVRSTATPGATAPPAASTGSVEAASIQVSPPVNGNCQGGFGGGFRGGDGAANPSGMPGGSGGTGAAGQGGAPTGPGAGGPGAGGAGGNGIPGGFGAFGQVIAATSGGFTVAELMRGGTDPSATATTPPPPPTPVQVMTSAATTVSVTVAATAGELTVGRCATAQGKTDDTGAMTATSIVIREAVDGTCNTGGPRSTAGASRG